MADEASSPRKVEAVIIASSNFSFPAIFMFGTHSSQGSLSCLWV